jgi:haloacetate dehalogenase
MPNSSPNVLGRRQLLQAAAALGAGAAQAQTPATHEPETIYPPNFKRFAVDTSVGATITGVIGGSGPPLLLMHGAPLTHVSWSQVAPVLAKDYTVVATDLRGYGDSSKPAGGGDHSAYSKRTMAQDNVDVMKHFGFDKFLVAGHDRGGRVAHRMALDHADKVLKVAVLDIVPTSKFYNSVTQASATAYWHWFFLIQPAPMPEKVMESNPNVMGPGNADTPTGREYRRVRTPEAIHGQCEDYRAGATIDMQHDREDNGKKITCPLLTLWAQRGPMGRIYDVLATWKELAIDVRGKELPGGHNLPDLSPKEVTAELQAFFKA